MSYDTRLAAALSGVTIGQLSYWRRASRGHPALLVPEYATSTRALYSFRDVVALRTAAFLREDSSLQRIRRALSTLKSLGEHEHVSKYRLVSTGDTIALVTDGEAVDLVKRPGQRLIAEMVEVLAPFTNRQGVPVPDFVHPRENLEVDEDILGGFPVIRGTRVPYNLVAALIEDGVRPGELSDYYPAVSAAAAVDAEDYARYVARLYA